MKIQTRLTINFTLLVVGLFTARSVVNYLAVTNYTQKKFYSRLHAKALSTADRLLTVNRIDSAILKEVDLAQQDLLNGETISIYDSTNRKIYSSNDSINFKLSKQLFENIKIQQYLRYTDGPYKVIGIYYASSSN